MDRADRLNAFCGVCRTEQPLKSFRRLSDWPLLYLDFCGACEERFGTLTLYRDVNLTAAITPKAKAFVLDDPKSAKVEQAMTDGREEQKRELARRELMRRRLIYFASQMRGPSYLAGWVHNDIARRLERFMQQVERKESPRLMLFVPPRHGKSLLGSEDFPSWIFGHHPDWEIIDSAYAVSLPVGFSRHIRDRLFSPEYGAVFPETKIRDDARGVEEWALTKGGRFRAAGVETGVTGTGAHILIIDDPIKDYIEAQSETIRNNAYNWYTTTARSRLAPGGGVLIIQTRWHDADLAGRLLTDQKEQIEAGLPLDEIDQWEVISYAALAEYDEYLMPSGQIEQAPSTVPEGARLLRSAGEALHPDRYSTKAMRRLRNTTPPAQWNALYQQNPVPDTGEYFTRDQFRTYVSLPGTEDEYAYFMAWDLAIGQKQTNDWTVGVVCALHHTGAIYVLDMIRGRFGTFEIITALVTAAQKWPLLQRVGLEDGQIKKTMQPLIEAAIQKEKLLFSLDETLKPVTDKMVRARPLQQKMQMGQMWFPAAQAWAGKMQDEMLRFPSGVHDDIVDALAWAVRMSMSIVPPVPKSFKNRPRKSWRDSLPRAASASSKNFMTA